MKKIKFRLFTLLVLLISSSCKSEVQRLDEFVDNAEIHASSYSNAEWQKSEDEYMQLVDNYLNSNKCFSEEEKQVAACSMGRYHALLLKNKIENASSFLKGVEKILPAYLKGFSHTFEENSKHIEEQFKELFNDEELEKSFESLTENNDTTKRMPVDQAEANMFTKQSEYSPTFSQSLSEDYRGDIYLQIQASLESNSLVSVLSDMINEETGVKGKMYSLNVQEEPVDTLFLDDFEIKDGNLGTQQEIIEVISYDKLWCGVLSDALEGIEKDKKFVKVCKANLDRHEEFFQTLKRKIQSNAGGSQHVPVLYVYRFSQFLSIYLESTQRPANYFFTGYSFVFADDMQIGCVVEEFNF